MTNHQRIAGLLAVIFCFGLFNYAQAALNTSVTDPDWAQETASGRDISESHDGNRWFVGQDGKAYHWDSATAAWVPHGSRSNFTRIDAGNAAIAALADNGLVYVNGKNSGDTWQSTGVRGSDVGVGGGYIWVADAYLKNGARANLVGTLTASGDVTWQTEVVGRLVRLDVDPKGRPWGVDANGAIFVYAEGEWIQDRGAPKASDIGVGGDGSIYAIGKEMDEKLGGGRVYYRNPADSRWSALPGRLSAISVTVDGKALGVNSRNWVIAGTGEPSEVGQPLEEVDITENKVEVDAAQTLREMVGDDLEIPSEIEDAVVIPSQGSTKSVRLGTTTLNGLPTYLAVVQHSEFGIPTMALTHQSMALENYMPAAGGTAFARMGKLDNPVFWFVHESNANAEFETADLALLKQFLARDDIAKDGYDSGMTLLATTNMVLWPDGVEAAALLGVKQKQLQLTAKLSPALFKQVTPVDTLPAPELDGTLEDLTSQYGSELFETAIIKVAIDAANLAAMRPISLKKPVLHIEWGEAFALRFVGDVGVHYVSPSSLAKEETLTVENTILTLKPEEKQATISGDIKDASDLIAREGYSLGLARFEGEFTLKDETGHAPKSLKDFKDFTFTAQGMGTVPSKTRKNVNADITVLLVADDDGEKLVPTLMIESDLMLSDIVGNHIPGADKVALTNVEASTNYVAGIADVNGTPIRAVRYEQENADAPAIIAIEHLATVDLGTYIPPIRNTSLGSFGLGNAVFFILPENAKAIEYASLSDIPDELSAMIGKEAEYKGFDSLTLHPGVTVVGMYQPTSDGNAAEVMLAYGMGEQPYAVQGNFKLSQLRNLTPRKFDPRLKVDKQAACEAVTSADVSGLNLRFPLPDFEPSYAKHAIGFSEAYFSLREIEGKIEPSIITAMTLKLDEAQAGIKNIPMSAKLQVQGELNSLCGKVDKNTLVQVAFAGSTGFNADEIEGVAFEALQRVTNQEAADAQNTEEGGESEKSEEEATRKAALKGWKNPFGLPYLTIRQYASSGTFNQKQSEDATKRTMTFAVWTDSTLDKADLDLYGSMDFSLNEAAKRLDIEDWSFVAPGPIAIKDLPGLSEFPKANELALRDVELAPEEMVGTLMWPKNNDLEAAAYLGREINEGKPDAFNLFARFNSLKPSMLSQHFPQMIAEATLSPMVVGWSKKETVELAMADAPEKLVPLFEDLLAEDESITVANGLTFAAKTDPQALTDAAINKLFELITFENDLVLLGALEVDDAGALAGEVTAILDTFKVNHIPETLLSFHAAELSLSTLDGKALEVATTADVVMPKGVGNITMDGTLRFESTSAKDYALTIEMASDKAWNEPFQIPNLNIADLGFEAEFSQTGEKATQSWGFVGDGEFHKQQGKVGIEVAAADGQFENALVSFEGNVILSKLLQIPASAPSIADATLTELLLSKNAVAGDVTFALNNVTFSGRGAVLTDGSEAAFFMRNDAPVAVGKMVPNTPAPMSEVSVPEGLFILSSKEVTDFDAHAIPDKIFEQVFGGLVEEGEAEKLYMEEGMTFLTKAKVDSLPPLIKKVMKDPFGLKDEIILGGSIGGIYGGDPAFGLYTVLKNVSPKMPGFVKEFVEFKNANLRLFVRSTAVENAVDIGLAADAWIKARRLDDPTQVQKLDSTLSLTYNVSELGTGMSAGAEVKGLWKDPMGLEGYALTNPSIAFGVEEKGTTVSVHTERAEFKEGNQTKAFVLDLDTTWASAVPTDLSVQLTKTKDTEKLYVTPVTMARLQKSIFDVAFRGSSKLSESVLSQLNGDAKNAMKEFTKLLDGAGNGMMALMEKSPMSMVGVENPVIYFGTPGSTPPSHPDVNRPPLGLGLHVAGTLKADTGGLKAELAEGVYKVNLKDGYLVSGSITPPAPFAENEFSVTGNMPIISTEQNALRLSGRLEVPAVHFISGIIPMYVDGTFDMRRGSMQDKKASVYADVSIGGVLSRKGTIAVDNTTISFNSPGSCGDLQPFSLSGSVDAANIATNPNAITQSLMSAASPDVGNVLECAMDLAKAAKKFAEKGSQLANKAKDALTDPQGALEGSIDDIGDGAGKVKDLVLSPGGTAKKAINMPLDMGEAVVGGGIRLVAAGVGKVPVLGPAAGQIMTAGLDKALQLNNLAKDAVMNNEATKWLGDSLGVAAGAVGGAVSAVAGAAWSSVKGLWDDDDDDPPPYYRISQSRCMPTLHYWNDAFTQCFEFGSVVLMDENNRGQGVGDCISYNHGTSDQLKVGKCFGTASNQFHLDTSTGQIKTTRLFYDGYQARFGSKDDDRCRAITWHENSKKVTAEPICEKDNFRSSWNYRDDMKLESGGQCLIRDSDDKLVMGDCANANQWLGTSIVPNWNEVERVPIRGKIRSANTNLCLWWDTNWRGTRQSQFSLVSCDKPQGYKDGIYYDRTYLRVLDENRTVEIKGSRWWDGLVQYGCLGARNHLGTWDHVNVNACVPERYYDENKWQVYAVNRLNKIDWTKNIPFRDIFRHHTYVFRNVKSGKCLSVEEVNPYDRTPTTATSNHRLETSKECQINGSVPEAVKFKGYEADNSANWVLVLATLAREEAFKNERLRVKQNLQEWQQYRMRAENDRITEVYKTTNYADTDIKVARAYRKSPGSCPPEEYWNQAMGRCSIPGKTMLYYLNEDGSGYSRCMRSKMKEHPTAGLYHNCNAVGMHDRVLDVLSYQLDEESRIVLPQKAANGKERCLHPTTQYMVRGRRGFVRIASSYCSDSETQKWKYSVTGELIAHNGQCLRETTIPIRRYGTKIDDNVSALTLEDCNTNPTPDGKLRWLPSIGQDYNAVQNLPRNAFIKSASDATLCLTGDMSLYGALTLEKCNDQDPNQYMALGAMDDTHFLISSRNSKTCLYDAGNAKVSHRVCKTSAPEAFEKMRAEGGVKLKHTATGDCLSPPATVQLASNPLAPPQPDQEIGLADCAAASAFTFDTNLNIQGVSFEPLAALKADQGMIAFSQALWEAKRFRATLLYMGNYLKHGNKQLQKGEDNSAVMSSATETVTLPKIPAGVSPPTFVPETQAPKTHILLLPGFADGEDRVTFAHSLFEATDPYDNVYPNWFKFVHMHRVMRVVNESTIRFDYIEEEDEFRKSATFHMVPALSGEKGKYSFKSILHPEKYLGIQNDKLVLLDSTDAASISFNIESVAKWMREEGTLRRGPSPPFGETNWRIGRGKDSILNTFY